MNRHVGSPALTSRTLRAEASSLSERADRALLGEIDVRHHPRCLQDSGKLDLAPRASCAARAQRTLQGRRRARKLRFALGGLAQLLGQGPVLARPLLLHPIDSLAHLLQLRANRRERVEDGVVPGRARLGMLDPAGQFLRARLPSGGLCAKRSELVARL